MASRERDNSLYDSLKWSHADLTKELNFGQTQKTADEVYRKLKIRIVDEYCAALQAQDHINKAMWGCIAVALVIWLGSAAIHLPSRFDNIVMPMFTGLIVLSIVLYKWARSYESRLMAYRDFDEDFFGGEVFYKLNKGLKI